uniref:HTR1515 n=1 Tax=Arundo donax TaxID=35708 RepID=A0A0A9CTA0_ARUDO
MLFLCSTDLISHVQVNKGPFVNLFYLCRLICVSRAMRCLLCRRLRRHTWWVSSRTPTCVPSMPSV